MGDPILFGFCVCPRLSPVQVQPESECGKETCCFTLREWERQRSELNLGPQNSSLSVSLSLSALLLQHMQRWTIYSFFSQFSQKLKNSVDFFGSVNRCYYVSVLSILQTCLVFCSWKLIYFSAFLYIVKLYEKKIISFLSYANEKLNLCLFCMSVI